jgi:hypothetical protein
VAQRRRIDHLRRAQRIDLNDNLGTHQPASGLASGTTLLRLMQRVAFDLPQGTELVERLSSVLETVSGLTSAPRRCGWAGCCRAGTR